MNQAQLRQAEYTRNKILTATPAELTLMLYEGAIKFCNMAIMAIEKGEIEKAHHYNMRVQKIIEEFQITLDRDYDIAVYYDDIYNYLLGALREANISKSKEKLEEVLEHLRTLREMWKEIMDKSSRENLSHIQKAAKDSAKARALDPSIPRTKMPTFDPRKHA